MKNDKNNSSNPSIVPCPGVVRCAIYARCATDVPTEDPHSVAEQIRRCTEYALKRRWEVAQEFVRSDIRASGVSPTECTSLLQLLEVESGEPRPFDCVLVAETSRLGRSIDRVLKLIDAFRVRGVFVQTVRGQFDSRMLLASFDEKFVNRIRQYRRPAGGQCPVCGR